MIYTCRTYVPVDASDVVIFSVNDVENGVEVVLYVVLEGGSGVLSSNALVTAIDVSLFELYSSLFLSVLMQSSFVT